MDKKRGGGLTIKTIQSFNLKQKKKSKFRTGQNMVSIVGVKNNQQLFVEVIIKSTQLISRRREMIHNGKSKQQIIDKK